VEVIASKVLAIAIMREANGILSPDSHAGAFHDFHAPLNATGIRKLYDKIASSIEEYSTGGITR
jgi:hypothetical protein